MLQPSAMIGHPTDPAGRSGGPLVIGLVNNMPKPALKSTEAEFRAVLDAGLHGYPVRLRCFALSGVPAPASYYEPVSALLDAPRGACALDGLIVTGTEPVADRLADEPYWPELAHLVDWAAENTRSAIWSCLAAQVAVFRLDGMVRRKLPAKLSGVFECGRACEHALLRTMPQRWSVPHSRLNDLDEQGLVARGYQILSRAPRAGADSFVKQVGQSLFLMLQGHPEYGADCLLREYRRDVRRFMLGQRPTWPEVPESYFDAATEAKLAGLRELADHQGADQRLGREIIARFDAAVTDMPAAVWHEPAARLYANWLDYLANCKQGAPEMAAMVAS